MTDRIDMDEQGILLRSYARAQARCSDALAEQARELARLHAQAIRLRAAVIVRESALQWEREDRLGPARAPLVIDDGMHHEDSEALEASLRAADVVICRTGCLSHGAYWRVQDHCKRTGKTCVMVDAPAVIDGAPIMVRHR